jgi:tetratricopeptide (TPR) repeat protein
MFRSLVASLLVLLSISAESQAKFGGTSSSFNDPSQIVISSQMMDSLQQLVESHKEQGEVHYYNALLKYNSNDVAGAYDDLNFYLGHPPLKLEYEARILLSRVHQRRLVPALGISECDKAMRLIPGRTDAYIEKSKIMAKQGRYSEGIVFLNGAIDKFGHPDLKLWRGILYVKAEKYKNALADLEIYLGQPDQDPPDASIAWMGKARCHIEMKKPDEALAAVNNAITVYPSNTDALGLRGEVYYIKQDYDSSLADFARFEETRMNSYYWPMVAKMYEEKGETALACAYYERICDMHINPAGCQKLKKLKCHEIIPPQNR